MTDSKVRVRFAPSPTGPLHIGGLRTALFNYLFAKKHKGQFLLRIEDTDQGRYVAGAEDYIINALKWCGIKLDEGVSVGGEYAPYRQSERKAIYKEYVEKLLASGHAYYAFDTAEELDAMRKKLQEEKADNQQYNFVTRTSMCNSLTLSWEEVKQKIEEGVPFVIRFKMPEEQEIIVHDLIRGNVKFNTKVLDDKVLYKSDGMPTYHLANVVDDYLMKITHVIRGEEWLPSLPLHAMLYEAFGWEEDMPDFAHLPLLLKPDGKGKLSKRDGDKMGFPVFPLEWIVPETNEKFAGYRENGYYPEAFVNMLAFLGWNPGTENEIFSIEELIEIFSLKRVVKSGARFNPEKTHWFNHQYLIKKTGEELAEDFAPILESKGIEADSNYVAKVCELMKERVSFVKELWEQSSFFFTAPEEYDSKVVNKRWKGKAPAAIAEIKDLIAKAEDFNTEKLHEEVKNYIQEKELGMGQIMNCLRLALVGSSKGPDLFIIIEMLGQAETVRRLEKAVEVLSA